MTESSFRTWKRTSTVFVKAKAHVDLTSEPPAHCDQSAPTLMLRTGESWMDNVTSPRVNAVVEL